MPEWITPELCPVWCPPTAGSLSTTASDVPGLRLRISRAAASPSIPPPTITTSYLVTAGLSGHARTPGRYRHGTNSAPGGDTSGPLLAYHRGPLRAPMHIGSDAHSGPAARYPFPGTVTATAAGLAGDTGRMTAVAG